MFSNHSITAFAKLRIMVRALKYLAKLKLDDITPIWSMYSVFWAWTGLGNMINVQKSISPWLQNFINIQLTSHRLLASQIYHRRRKLSAQGPYLSPSQSFLTTSEQYNGPARVSEFLCELYLEEDLMNGHHIGSNLSKTLICLEGDCDRFRSFVDIRTNTKCSLVFVSWWYVNTVKSCYSINMKITFV